MQAASSDCAGAADERQHQPLCPPLLASQLALRARRRPGQLRVFVCLPSRPSLSGRSASGFPSALPTRPFVIIHRRPGWSLCRARGGARVAHPQIAARCLLFMVLYHQPAPSGAIAVRWLAACPGRRTRSLTGGSTQPALSNRGHCSEHLHSSHADNGIISSFIMQFCIAMSAPPNQPALLPLRRAADHPTIFRMSGDVNFWTLGCVGRGIMSREPIAARKLSWALHTRPATFAR